MKQITIQGQPAFEPDINPNVLVELENWCDRYAKYKCELTPTLRFCVGVYQTGQAILIRDKPIVCRECVGAAFIHYLTSLKKVGGSCTTLGGISPIITNWPRKFDGMNLSLNIGLAMQMFFYYDYARKSSYRRKRFNINSLENEILRILLNIITLCPNVDFIQGLEEASEILLREAWKE